uniref:Post-GPI attachment to proteins factor 3 n=1 Tax=Panstrongylus lignarius TaxID=156445 RepID=A0A224XSD8_9HEMI
MKLMLLSAVLAYLDTIAASLGNTFPTYKSCVESCTSDICSPDGYYFANPELTSLPLLLLWKCSDDCQYRCMWGVVDTFQKKGWPPPQFHGKWPFVRILGIQEPASTLFSLLNFGLHAKSFSKFLKDVRYSNPMYKVWIAYALISMNGWIWSAIFHTRDTPFTELMDYLSAFGLVFSSAYGVGMRLLLFKRRIFSIAFTVLCLLFYVNHAIYLSSGLFDYKYNLFANIVVGTFLVLNCILFIVINRSLPQTKALTIAVTTITGALYLEIIDFPPYFWILDAHSLWHLLTAPVTHYFWRNHCERGKQRFIRIIQAIRPVAS